MNYEIIHHLADIFAPPLSLTLLLRRHMSCSYASSEYTRQRTAVAQIVELQEPQLQCLSYKPSFQYKYHNLQRIRQETTASTDSETYGRGTSLGHGSGYDRFGEGCLVQWLPCATRGP